MQQVLEKELLEKLKNNFGYDSFRLEQQEIIQNVLVKNNKLKLIDFDQCLKISDLKRNIFLKTRVFFDEYSFNRINLSINQNIISSNDLRILIVWDPKKIGQIEKEIYRNKNIQIIDKTKIKKKFYHEDYKDRIYWIDQYNKNNKKRVNFKTRFCLCN